MQYGINNIANNTAIIYAVYFFFFFFFAKQSYKAYQHLRNSEINQLLWGAQSDTEKGVVSARGEGLGTMLAINLLPLLPLALTPYGCHSQITHYTQPLPRSPSSPPVIVLSSKSIILWPTWMRSR